MAEPSLFAQSLLIGLSIAAPVGPIGLLVIQRTLQRGALVGLATGLGAALADGLYGAVGAFGVSWIIEALSGARVPLALGGGAFLLWLAWRIAHTPPTETAANRDTFGLRPSVFAPGAARRALAGTGQGLASCLAGTFMLTLSNPATIFSFIAIFGALGANFAGASPWTMIAGVLLGSALWWLLLSALVGRLRRRFDARERTWVNRLSAALLAGFALWQWAGLFGG